MTNPAQTLDRLLSALEDLLAGERSALHAGDYAAVADLQARAEPVIARLVDLAPSAGSDIRTRVSALVKRREEQGSWLRDAMNQARDELTRMTEGSRVVARIAPVYGRRPTPASAGAIGFSGQA